MTKHHVIKSARIINDPERPHIMRVGVRYRVFEDKKGRLVVCAVGVDKPPYLLAVNSRKE